MMKNVFKRFGALFVAAFMFYVLRYVVCVGLLIQWECMHRDWVYIDPGPWHLQIVVFGMLIVAGLIFLILGVCALLEAAFPDDFTESPTPQ